MPQPILIFDLDGTLADTAPDLLATLNRICPPCGLSPVSKADIGQIVGQGAKAMISRAFELQEMPLDDTMHDALFNEFLSDYGANIANETRLFDGLLEALDLLSAENFRFCVCTNKAEKMARKLIGELGLQERFDSITGGDTFEFRKPDPRHLEETVRLANGDIAQAIMIGDSNADIGAAISAKIPSIAVSFGYSNQPVVELGANVIIDHFSQLPGALRQILDKA